MYPEIAIRGNTLLFPQPALFRAQKELTGWYVREARAIITKRVQFYAKQMHTSYLDLTFSDTRSQWGSCSSDNKLQFSWRLIMAPLLVIDYVVIHELAHTKEKNHSWAFWSKVRYFKPTYRLQKQWLDSNGVLLII